MVGPELGVITVAHAGPQGGDRLTRDAFVCAPAHAPMQSGARVRSKATASAAEEPAWPLPGPPQLKVHTWYVLNRAAQRLREMVEAALLTKGLRRRHYAALLVIDAEGPLTQSELSSRIPVDRVAMVSVIDDLEAMRLATRRQSPTDRRAYLLTLTPKGIRTLAEARALVEAADAEGLSLLAPEDIARLDSLARQLCGWEQPSPKRVIKRNGAVN